MAARTLRIIVVEPDAVGGAGLGARLRSRLAPGATVSCCPDIAVAADSIRQGATDLVLLDGRIARDSENALREKIGSDDVAESIIVVSSDHTFIMPPELSKLGIRGPVFTDDQDGAPLLQWLREGIRADPDRSLVRGGDGLLTQAFANLKSGLVICDAAGSLVMINPRARDMLGLSERQCLPGLAAPRIAAFSAEPVRPLDIGQLPLERALAGNTVEMIRLVHRCGRTGEDVPLTVSGSPLRDSTGNVRGAMIVLHDADAPAPMSEELAFLSQHDSLTGVANRKMFMDLLKRAIGRAEDSPGMLGLFFLDLDRFKEINDSLGHAIGDRLLAGVGKRLRERLRVGDIVGRIGGDEFAVLLENLSSNTDAARIARNVIEELGRPFDFDGRPVQTTPSIGIATYPQCGRTAAALLQAADEAMYKAKQGGRNTYHFYSEGLDREIRRKADLEEALRGALGRDEFRLVYQPVFALPERRLIALDAQLRWRHPIQGEIAPQEFVPLLESVGAINAVSEWALASACLELSEWRRTRPELRLSFRASPRLFRRRTVVDGIARILRNAGLPGDCLELEISTELVNSKIVDSTTALNAIGDEGIHISLRDFGVKPVAIDTLAQLPLSKLKLHRRVVAGLPRDRMSVTIAQTLKALADGLSLALAADGVEHAGQLEWLEERGWPAAQGNLLEAPLPALGVTELMQSRAAQAV